MFYYVAALGGIVTCWLCIWDCGLFHMSIKPHLNLEPYVDSIYTVCECLIKFPSVVGIIEDDFRQFPKLSLWLQLFNVSKSVSFQTD